MPMALIRALVACCALGALALPACAQGKKLIVAEPVHGTGYLPLYVAIRKGYFAEDGLDVSVLTIDSGAGHTNAVLTGQAFAFIGGPEHDAFAKLKGAELRAVVNCVDRGNVYFMARKGQEPKPGQSLADAFKGKSIAVSFVGGTPNSILRHYIKQWHLDAKSDVTIMEMANAAVLAAAKSGNAQTAVATEPFVTQGVVAGVWGDPVINVPRDLGPYAYSVLNVRQASIKDDPATVAKFVRGMIRALKFTYAQPDEAAAIAKMEFPTMAAADLKATLDRSFADELWSRDGMISPESWKTAASVVLDAGILKQDVPYEDIIDMQFVKAAQ